MLSLLTSLAVLSSVGRFLHLTDVHYDLLYEPGSPTKCVLGSTGLGCCHKYDLPITNSTKASKWGDYNCDTSRLFLEETLKYINTNLQPLDFVFYTGDSAGHHDFANTPSIIMDTITDMDQLLRNNFPGKPIYNNLGNHDAWPIDQTTPIEYNHILSHVSELWSQGLDSVSKDNIKKGGYYSIMLNNFTRLISFNSIYYDGHNLFKHKKNLANDDQICWLKTMLDKSRTSNHQVWFISHIFPSAGESTDEYNAIMKDILWEYKDIIKYQWWGHSHNDQFILLGKNDSNNELEYYSAGMVSPSIMPDKRFPAFRIYEYDTNTFKLIDYTQYYSNLTKVISEDKMIYEKHYSFRESYSLNGLEVSDLKQLYLGIKNNTLNNPYCNHYTPGFFRCQTDNILVI